MKQTIKNTFKQVTIIPVLLSLNSVGIQQTVKILSTLKMHGGVPRVATKYRYFSCRGPPGSGAFSEPVKSRSNKHIHLYVHTSIDSIVTPDIELYSCLRQTLLAKLEFDNHAG